MSAVDGTPADPLAPLIGRWKLLAGFGDTPAADIGARATFEWLPGGRFVIQRWVVPMPEAPDGIAVIGADPEEEGRYLQHYFDSRGVARVYKMRLAGREWELSRHEPDFSPLDFAQREGRAGAAALARGPQGVPR